MAITLSGTHFYNSKYGITSGSKSAGGLTASAAADAAYNSASSAANSALSGLHCNPASGGSSDSTLRVGSTTTGTTAVGRDANPSYNPSLELYSATSSWSAERTSRMDQVKFTFSSSDTSAAIATATLSLTFTQNNTTAATYYVIAPAGTTQQGEYKRYSENTLINKDIKVSFTGSSQTTSTTKTIDITSIYKKCLDLGAKWFVIAMDKDYYEYNRYIIISSASITVTYAYTKTTAPTSVTANVSIQKPGGSATITVSGATAGTNNAINGYTIYWKAGSAPTTSSYDGTGSIASGSTTYSFTVPSGATRGATYYIKAVTKGAAGADWGSGISTAQATVKVNTLPNAPSASATPTRIKSTGSTSVSFTVSAGTDSDGQTRTLYYATSASGTKTVFTSPLTVSLSAAATYYFWTYDTLEYSSSYASVSIVKNTAPTIGSITMTAVATYSPSSSTNNRSYVKNINGSASNVTKDNAATLTYQWKLLIGNGVDVAESSITTATNISTATSLSNIDVTSYGASFNKAYRLQLVVTDDVGDTASAISSQIFCIPAAPTISSIYNQKSNSNVSGANTAHFGRYIRIYYSTNNTGLTRELQYSTSNTFTSFETISLSGTEYSDIDLNNLTHGTTYYFRVKFICNSQSINSDSFNRTRSADLTPTSISITPQNVANQIKPYTDTNFSFTCTNGPLSLSSNYDVDTSFTNVYTAKLVYGSRNQNLSISGSISSGTVNGTATINSITIANWATLIGVSPSPNSSYTVTFSLTVTNKFGEIFSNTLNYTFNFIEGIKNTPTIDLKIKMVDGTYESIPSGGGYPVFERQTLQLTLSGLQVYAAQSFEMYFLGKKSGNTDWIQYSKITIDLPSTTSNLWTLSSDGRYYTLNGTKTIDYILPHCTDDDFTMVNALRIKLNNGQEYTSSDISRCFLYRYHNAVLTLTSVGESNSNFTINWECTQFGGNGQATQYTQSYSAISMQPLVSTVASSGYTTLGNKTYLTDVGTTSMSSTGSITVPSSSTSGDILYFGIKLGLELKYTAINNKMPAPADGSPSRINEVDFINLAVLYRTTPTVLYGKNFLTTNVNAPMTNITDQVLEIHKTETRNKIYIGEVGSYGVFEITQNGLVIDCGSW